jgi:hypothetical protein
LGSTLQCVKVQQNSLKGICFKIFEQTVLPTTLKELHFDNGSTISELIVRKCSSLPQLEKLLITQSPRRIYKNEPLPKYFKDLKFPLSLQEFTLTEATIMALLPVICKHLTEECPNLEKLTLFNVWIGGPKKLQLPKNIKHFKGGGMHLPRISQALLASSPNIESLTITTLDFATNEATLIPSFKNLKSLYLSSDVTKDLVAWIDPYLLFTQKQYAILLQTNITSLTIDAYPNGLSHLQKTGKELPNKLTTLRIATLSFSLDKKTVIDSLAAEYPHLEVIVG